MLDRSRVVPARHPILGRVRSFDLMIIGTGSGNSVIGPEHDDLDIAVIERGSFGGTCLNVGCIPSKMFVHTAEMAHNASDGSRFGLDSSFNSSDWGAIRDRVFGRIDPIAESGRQWRHELAHVTVYESSARFVGPKQVAVSSPAAPPGSNSGTGAEIITASDIVIAAGGRPVIPDIAGLAECGYHTSDTIMRLDVLPERLLVLGGGYIAVELGAVMGALGCEVTFVVRGDRLLRHEDDDIAQRLSDAYSTMFKVMFGTRVLSANRHGDSDDGPIVLEVTQNGSHRQLCGDQLLVATGRRPNSDELDLAASGIELDPAGFVVTDPQCRSNVAGVWALGDIANPIQLKHVANHEARVVRHNLSHLDDPIEVDHRFIPHAVFGNPQIASVGLTERSCQARAIPYASHVQHYGSAAYGWALEDTASVVKVIAHAETRQLIGAHVIGPLASTLLQQLIQGMHFGLTVDEMARQQYYIHPAPPEVVEQALLAL